MSFTEQLFIDMKASHVVSSYSLACRLLRALEEQVEVTCRQTTDRNLILQDLQRFEQRVMDVDERNTLLYNCMRYVLHAKLPETTKVEDIVAHFHNRIMEVERHLKVSFDTIVTLGTQKIKPGSKIFVYGFNKYILEILLEAKKNKVTFDVIVCEAAPSSAGKTLAVELDKVQIPHSFVKDSMIRYALRRSDLVLVDVEAIDKSMVVIAPVGAELVCEMAHANKCYVYAPVDCWQFDPSRLIREDNQRMFYEASDIWTDAPVSTEVVSIAYEKLDSRDIDYFVSELGILSTKHFVEQCRLKYPDIF